jgi:hypothetical protein
MKGRSFTAHYGLLAFWRSLCFGGHVRQLPLASSSNDGSETTRPFGRHRRCKREQPRRRRDGSKFQTGRLDP